MNSHHYIVATAGHVDHGKSSLVKALTGTDPDRLPEEKSRGITIELGFAHLDLTDSSSPENSVHIGLVDVPGHKDFVKNMTAGVSSADVALLVIAANDGWMPQTTEHLEILTYLGVKRAIVALTKIDLVDDDVELTTSIRERLTDTPFTDAPIVPISTITGRGLTELKSALLKMLLESPTAEDFGKPRLFVDRVFVLKHAGTVVTGTLTGGSLLSSQQVVIQPHGQRTRIRSIESNYRGVQSSYPGCRTALSLSHVSPRLAHQTKGIRRGDVVTAENLGEPSLTFNAMVMRIRTEHNLNARPLKTGTRVRIHHGSANTPARIYFLESRELLPGDKLLAQIRLESPMHAFEQDRFVVRDWSQRGTLAGGLILETHATRSNYRSPSQRKFLAKRARTTECAKSWLLSRIERDKVVERESVLVMSHFSRQQVQGAVNEILREKKALALGDLVVDDRWWSSLIESAVHMIEERHVKHPEQLGLNLTELEAAIPASHRTNELFQLLVSSLCENGFTKQKSFVRKASHLPSLPVHLQEASETLLSILERQALDPPSKQELVNNKITSQALHFLLETDQVVEISEKTIMSAETFSSVMSTVTELLHRQGSATVSEFGIALGVSRRIAIPLLEKLDRDGITYRDGNTRFLRKTPK